MSNTYKIVISFFTVLLIGSVFVFTVEAFVNPNQAPPTGAGAFTFTAGGRVGLGNTSPQAKLDVNGTVRSAGSLGSFELFDLDSPNTVLTNLFRIRSGPDIGSLRVQLNTNSQGLFDSSTPIELMVIKDNGNIGIGLSSPSYRLDVSGGDINVSGVYRKSGTAGSTATCPVGQVLKGIAVSGGIVTGGSCAADDAGSGMTNPMTTLGDIIYGGASGIPTRLGGTAGFLKSTGAAVPAWSSVNLASSDVTGILAAGNGGTGNAFFQVAGPATAIRTYTFPNANATIATLGQVQTFSGAKTFSADVTFPGSGIWNTSGNVGVGSAVDPAYRITTAGGGIKTASAVAANPAGYFTNTGVNGYALLVDQGNVGIGTLIPDILAKLEIAGQIKITGGAPGLNKVLTSDAAGLATWQTPSSVSAYNQIQEEGSITGLTQRTNLNFIGSAITAADDSVNSRTNVTLSLSPSSASVVGIGRQIISGSGLTGGGDLSLDRTLDVGAGTGISVAADTVAINTTAVLTWTGVHTFNGGANFPGTGVWNTSGQVGVGSAVDPAYKVTVSGATLGGIKSETTDVADFAGYFANTAVGGTGLFVGDGTIRVTELANCSSATGKLYTDASGNLACGTDAGSGGGLSDVTGTAPIVVTTPSAGIRNVALGPVTPCASGQILKWNGTAWVCNTDLTGGAGGSLPAGSAVGETLYWDGTNWLNSSNLINNGTNVGIGGSNPGTVKFDVLGSIDSLLRLTRSGAANPTTFRLGADSAMVIANSGLDTLTLKSGLVGINTGAAGPLAKLHIKASDNSWGAGIRIEDDVTANYFNIIYDNVLRITYGDGTAYGIVMDTTGKVGIGTAGPAAPLHVYGSTPAGFQNANYGQLHISAPENVNGNYAKITFTNAYASGSTPNAAIGARFDGAGSSLFFGTSNNYAVGVNNAALTIDPSGNIGINNTVPGQKLTVESGGASTDVFRVSASAGSSAFTVRESASPTNALYLRMFNFGGTEMIRFNPESDSFINSGRLGIGVNPPLYKLDISGGALRVTSASAPTGANGVMYYDTVLNKFRCYENAAWKDCDTSGSGAAGGGTLNYLTKVTNPSPFTIGNSQIVDDGTNVGIGTAGSSANKLQIGLVGATGYAGNELALGDGVTAFAIDQTGTETNFWSSTGRYVFNSGNVGIGNSSPSYKLDVSGTTQLNGGASPALIIRAANASPWSLQFKRDDLVGQDALIYQSAANALTLSSILNVTGTLSEAGSRVCTAANGLCAGSASGWTYTSPNVFLTSSTDNVGIGTAVPAAKLDIRTDASGVVGPVLQLTNRGAAAIGTAASIRFAPYTSSYTAEIQGIAETTAARTGIAFLTHDGGAYNEKMRIAGNGNIGIGTASPFNYYTPGVIINGTTPGLAWNASGAALNTKTWDFYTTGASFYGRVVNDAGSATANWLQVNRSAATITNVNFPNGNVGIGINPATTKLDVRGNIRLGDGTTVEQDLNYVSLNGNWQVGTNNSGNGTLNNQFFVYDTTYRLTVQNGTGNVGVGTAGPASKLHVNESSVNPMSIRFSNTENVFGWGTDNNEAWLYDYTDNLYRIRVDTNGNVGIGAISPTQKLDVDGRIRARQGVAVYTRNNYCAVAGEVADEVTIASTCLTRQCDVDNFYDCSGGCGFVPGPVSCSNTLVGRLVDP